jgi:hypothetical protein
VGSVEDLDCLDAADVDDNGKLDVADAIRNLNYQFVGSAAMPESPGPFQCGPDPTREDGLDCQKFEVCP